MSTINQNPEQVARDNIDKQLKACGWTVQHKKAINLGASLGVAVREYQTDAGPADYLLFVDKKPVGVIEAKEANRGFQLTQVEDQSSEYAQAKLKYLNNDPLPFVYESTGEVTRFTDYRDAKPRSRPVFSFHRPETFQAWLKQADTLRNSFQKMPELPMERLRDCQINAITKLEKSFRQTQPRTLIQMATGAGKTFTAITFIYRLLKYTNARRILFLVDTKNLGEQAEQEFLAYLPNDDNRKFSEFYGVHRLKSSYIPTDNHVYISTIQRLYSILKGTELDESAELENPNERWQPIAESEIAAAVEANQAALIEAAAEVFTGEFNGFIENLRRVHEQIIDTINPDKLLKVGWDADNQDKAAALVSDFRAWIAAHRDEITALQIFYNQPLRRRELSYAMIRELLDALKADRPMLSPLNIWRAYEQLEQANGSPQNELVALVSLVRRVCGIDETLTAYDCTVDRNFQQWVFGRQAGALKFSEEQMEWLRMIKDYIAASFHIEKEDFELSPFDAKGGLGKMWQLFGEQMEPILDELNEALAA